MTTMTTNTGIKPVGCDVLLKYKCPKCKGIEYIELHAAKTKGYMVSCGCGNVYPVRHILNAKFIPTYETDKAKPQPEVRPCRLGDTDVARAMSIIMSSGFSKDETKVLVTAAIMQHPNISSVTDLVQHSLAQETI